MELLEYHMIMVYSCLKYMYMLKVFFSDDYNLYLCTQIVPINLIILQVSLVDEGTSSQQDCRTSSPKQPEFLAEEYM